MTDASIGEKLRGFILDELHPRESAAELTDDYPLLEKQVLDSMGIFEIVAFIEAEFSIRVGDEELVREHFGTIADIARLIEEKQAASPSA